MHAFVTKRPRAERIVSRNLRIVRALACQLCHDTATVNRKHHMVSGDTESNFGQVAWASDSFCNLSIRQSR
jgi:hypothetical protein